MLIIGLKKNKESITYTDYSALISFHEKQHAIRIGMKDIWHRAILH
jgi:hypothetical protein